MENHQPDRCAVCQATMFNVPIENLPLPVVATHQAIWQGVFRARFLVDEWLWCCTCNTYVCRIPVSALRHPLFD